MGRDKAFNIRSNAEFRFDKVVEAFHRRAMYGLKSFLKKGERTIISIDETLFGYVSQTKNGVKFAPTQFMADKPPQTGLVCYTATVHVRVRNTIQTSERYMPFTLAISPHVVTDTFDASHLHADDQYFADGPIQSPPEHFQHLLNQLEQSGFLTDDVVVVADAAFSTPSNIGYLVAKGFKFVLSCQENTFSDVWKALRYKEVGKCVVALKYGLSFSYLSHGEGKARRLVSNLTQEPAVDVNALFQDYQDSQDSQVSPEEDVLSTSDVGEDNSEPTRSNTLMRSGEGTIHDLYHNFGTDMNGPILQNIHSRIAVRNWYWKFLQFILGFVFANHLTLENLCVPTTANAYKDAVCHDMVEYVQWTAKSNRGKKRKRESYEDLEESRYKPPPHISQNGLSQSSINPPLQPTADVPQPFQFVTLSPVTLSLLYEAILRLPPHAAESEMSSQSSLSTQSSLLSL